jgi:hypothetical protein
MTGIECWNRDGKSWFLIRHIEKTLGVPAHVSDIADRNKYASLLKIHDTSPGPSMFRRAKTLGCMPEFAVLSKLIRRPNQSDEIPDAATDYDTRGTVVPSENESAGRYGHSSHQRVDEEYFLFMRPEIVGL